MVQTSSRAVGVLDLPTRFDRYSTSILEEDILRLEGVRSAKVNNAQGKITVEFDPSVTSFEQIRDKVRQSG